MYAHNVSDRSGIVREEGHIRGSALRDLIEVP